MNVTLQITYSFDFQNLLNKVADRSRLVCGVGSDFELEKKEVCRRILILINQ